MRTKNMIVPAEVSKVLIEWAATALDVEVTVQKEPHGDEGAVYRLNDGAKNYFLKIKMASDLSKERERLEWLRDRLPVPQLIDHKEIDGNTGILLSEILGKNLKVLCEEWAPEKIIDKLVEALKKFHSTDTAGWSFDEPSAGVVLVHGDACLPNFIFSGDVLSGYIDLADVRLASPEVDLAAALWSLEHNLGQGFGTQFLEKYGWCDTSGTEVERLIRLYKNYQRAQGYLL